MAKRQDLDFQRSSRSEQSNQPAPDQFAELHHRGEASPDSLLFASRFRFTTGTTQEELRIIDAAMSAIDRGEFATDEEVETVFAKFRPA